MQVGLVKRILENLLQATEHNIFYDLPMQSKQDGKSLEIQPDTIDSWFSELPKANTQACAKEIYQALKKLNSSQAGFKKRLYFMEKVHPAVIDNTAVLSQLVLNRNLPLDVKDQRIATMIQQLHMQMAIGYKALLFDILKTKLGLFNLYSKKQQALVIQRIIRHSSFILLNSYQLYTIPTKGLWSTLHQLFLLAERKKISNTNINDPAYQILTSVTVKHTYLQILLLAVADPYRMAQHHIGAVFTQLEIWSQLADLRYFTAQDDKRSLIIDLGSDMHPGLRVADDFTGSQNNWILDTSKLNYDDLAEHFAGKENQAIDLTAELLRQLSLTWGVSSKRQHQRTTVQSTIKVAIGLNNTYFVLNGYNEPDWLSDDIESKPKGPVFSEESKAAAHFEAHRVNSLLKADDVWGGLYSADKHDPSAESLSHHTDPDTTARSMEKGIHSWDVVNESDGGYCLLWDQNEAINVKVGEVVALRHEEANSRYWSVASIRWIKCLCNNAVQMGVKILAPNALPVSISKYTRMHQGPKARAILLPAISAHNQPQTLISTALGYRAGDQILLEEASNSGHMTSRPVTKLSLQNMLENSTHFSRFKFSLIEVDSSTASKDHLPADGAVKFDSPWDDL